MNNALEFYLLHLADNALILSHRNSEWCGHGPVLEQDIALTNISLDLLGQARYFYQYAAKLHGEGFTEDSLAYLRDTNQFRNCLICELPNNDWGFTIMRQFIFSLFQFHLFGKIRNSSNSQIAAIATKSLKETTYHLNWSKQWLVRLGDGTIESRAKMAAAWLNLRDYVYELFTPCSYEMELANQNIAFDTSLLWNHFNNDLSETFNHATIPFELPLWSQTGGKDGIHTEHLGFILAEMQYLQRVYPGLNW